MKSIATQNSLKPKASAPDDDQMVLVGESVLPFIGQNHCGVVAGFMSTTI